MNQKTKILLDYKKFVKLAKKINPYNFRQHALRKLRYDFENYHGNSENYVDHINNLNNDYDKLNRIVTIQNLYIPYQDFEYRNEKFN